MKTRTPTSPRSSRSLAAWIFPVLVIAIPLLFAGALAAAHFLFAGPTPTATATRNQISTLPASHGPVHENVVTTVFWVGEAADSENDHISNVPSAWDEQWEKHYGGFDDPNHRSGYNPAKFTPRENPFYFALPYNDLDENGNRRATGHECLAYSPSTNDKYSWCKNSWIAIAYGNKTVYAQWEDVGPNEENDPAYVFGTAKQKNTFGEKAGLDVSPAVRDYLGLDGSDPTSWAFVRADKVPNGPWKTVVTTSPGYEVTQ